MSHEPLTVEQARVMAAELESEIAEFVKLKLTDFRAALADHRVSVVGVKVQIAPGHKVSARLFLAL